MARDTDDLLQVKRDGGAAFEYEGVLTYIQPGMVARKGHPIIKGHEDHFEPLYVHFDMPAPEVEEQEPAEKSSTAGTVKSTRAAHAGARAR